MKLRHKPIEVFATAINLDGSLSDSDFPIPVTVERTGGQGVDAIYGPYPFFKVTWHREGLPQCPETIRVAGCELLVATPYINGGKGYWLSAASPMSLSFNYERVGVDV